MGASCAVPEGAFSSPLPHGKAKGGKKEKTSGERRAETFPLLLHRAGQQGSLRLPFPSVRWEVTINYVPLPCSASPGLQHPLPGLRGVSQSPALGDAGQGELRSQNRAQAVSAPAPSDPPVQSHQLQRETHGTFRPLSPDGWHGVAPRLCSQLPNKLPGGSVSSQELLPLPVNAGDGREGTSRTCIYLLHPPVSIADTLPNPHSQVCIPPSYPQLLPTHSPGWSCPGPSSGTSCSRGQADSKAVL